MSKPMNASRPRWFHNDRVQEFYATIPNHVKHPSSLEPGRVAKMLPSSGQAPASSSTSELPNTTTNDSTRQGQSADQETLQPKQTSTSSIRPSKPIPRKLFKVIKKKLQKRERRRLAAIGERVPCNASVSRVSRVGTHTVDMSTTRTCYLG